MLLSLYVIRRRILIAPQASTSSSTYENRYDLSGFKDVMSFRKTLIFPAFSHTNSCNSRENHDERRRRNLSILSNLSIISFRVECLHYPNRSARLTCPRLLRNLQTPNPRPPPSPPLPLLRSAYKLSQHNIPTPLQRLFEISPPPIRPLYRIPHPTRMLLHNPNTALWPGS